MPFENERCTAQLLFPFFFDASEKTFAKLLSKLDGGFLRRETCHADFLLEPVRAALNGTTAACFTADRSSFAEYGIEKNPGQRYLTEEKPDAESFCIGGARVYIFDSGVGVAAIEINDAASADIIQRLRRLRVSALKVYRAVGKNEYKRIDICEAIRGLLGGLLEPFGGTAALAIDKASPAVVFSVYKTADPLTEEQAREKLAAQLSGSGTRDAVLANFENGGYQHPYPGAYWYTTHDGVSCVLALAESAAVTNMQEHMFRDYLLCAVLALHRQYTVAKLTGGRLDRTDAKTAASIEQFRSERTFDTIADSGHRHCQKLYELACASFGAEFAGTTVAKKKKKSCIPAGIAAAAAFILTLIGGISECAEIAGMLSDSLGFSTVTSKALTIGLIALLIVLEIIVFAANIGGKGEE